MAKMFAVSYKGGTYFVLQHTRKKPVKCDSCESDIKKGMYYVEADAGEKYCLDCST